MAGRSSEGFDSHDRREGLAGASRGSAVSTPMTAAVVTGDATTDAVGGGTAATDDASVSWRRRAHASLTLSRAAAEAAAAVGAGG